MVMELYQLAPYIAPITGQEDIDLHATPGLRAVIISLESDIIWSRAASYWFQHIVAEGPVVYKAQAGFTMLVSSVPSWVISSLAILILILIWIFCIWQ